MVSQREWTKAALLDIQSGSGPAAPEAQDWPIFPYSRHVFSWGRRQRFYVELMEVSAAMWQVLNLATIRFRPDLRFWLVTY